MHMSLSRMIFLVAIAAVLVTPLTPDALSQTQPKGVVDGGKKEIKNTNLQDKNSPIGAIAPNVRPASTTFAGQVIRKELAGELLNNQHPSENYVVDSWANCSFVTRPNGKVLTNVSVSNPNSLGDVTNCIQITFKTGSEILDPISESERDLYESYLITDLSCGIKQQIKRDKLKRKFCFGGYYILSKSEMGITRHWDRNGEKHVEVDSTVRIKSYPSGPPTERASVAEDTELKAILKGSQTSNRWDVIFSTHDWQKFEPGVHTWGYNVKNRSKQVIAGPSTHETQYVLSQTGGPNIGVITCRGATETLSSLLHGGKTVNDYAVKGVSAIGFGAAGAVMGTPEAPGFGTVFGGTTGALAGLDFADLSIWAIDMTRVPMMNFLIDAARSTCSNALSVNPSEIPTHPGEPGEEEPPLETDEGTCTICEDCRVVTKSAPDEIMEDGTLMITADVHSVVCTCSPTSEHVDLDGDGTCDAPKEE